MVFHGMESNVAASEDKSESEEQSVTPNTSIDDTKITQNAFKAKELALGGWPRRLLYV